MVRLKIFTSLIQKATLQFSSVFLKFWLYFLRRIPQPIKATTFLYFPLAQGSLIVGLRVSVTLICLGLAVLAGAQGAATP